MTNRPFRTAEEPENPLPPLLFGGSMSEKYSHGKCVYLADHTMQTPQRAADQETRGQSPSRETEAAPAKGER